MLDSAKREPQKPKSLEISIYAQAKDFFTDSVGYYVSEKDTTSRDAEWYQCRLFFTLIRSRLRK
jgi:hypothetical protein